MPSVLALQLVKKVPELFSPRWEDGWEKSIIDWQDELGITEPEIVSIQDEFANIMD